MRAAPRPATTNAGRMQVSFIIPLFNGLAHTRECLRTLQATLPAGLAHEIIYVDDGSTDGSREWLASLPAPCRFLLNEKNLGFAGACNRAAATTQGELLFFLNNDLVLLPGWFEPMRALLRRPHAGLVGNLQLRAATGELDHAGVCFNAKGKPEHDLRRPLWSRVLGHRAVPAVTGACFGVSRANWQRLGAFDDGFRNGGEDIDLALRARAAGLTNFVSLRSVVRHHVSASAGRKLRDEQNSHRLAARWRKELGLLSVPAWSWHYLSTRWHGAGDHPDLGLAREALAHSLHLGGPPSRELLAAIDASLEIEFARWREILDGTACPAAPRPSMRTDEI